MQNLRIHENDESRLIWCLHELGPVEQVSFEPSERVSDVGNG